jgi:chorismate-pyruvate lyase
MIVINAGSLLEKLSHLDQSTTLFLESIKGQSLKVAIESQVEGPEDSLIRTVRLYFDSAYLPLLYCISRLNTANLSPEEYSLLTRQAMPIGRIFKYSNPGAPIVKRNTTVTIENNAHIAGCLNIKPSTVKQKRYDYWVGEREIGTITEYFNQESLARIYVS